LPLYPKFRPMLGGWKFLFLDGEQFKPDTSKPAPWNRGAYLVNGPGHCAECHSPRNPLGGIVKSQRFAGGPDPEGGDGSVPNITPAGIGDYSQRDIERILESGDMPNRDSGGGLVAAVGGNTSKVSGVRRSRSTSNRCRRSKARSVREQDRLSSPRQSAASQNALNVMMVRVSWMPGMVCTFSLTKWPMSVLSST